MERISLPKDKDGVQKPFGFITYKQQASVPYALAIFSGTKLFNREIRLNNRSANHTSALAPIHQFQIHMPRDSSALLGMTSALNPIQEMMPRNTSNQSSNAANPQISIESLMGFSSQLLQKGNDDAEFDSNSAQHQHQSKIMHRHENRSHHQNSNYARRSDYDRSGDRERDKRHYRDSGRDNDDDRTRDREGDRHRSRGKDRDNWMRNTGSSRQRNNRKFF